MPRKDGTGPIGMGAKTGRCVGYCNNLGDANSIGEAYFRGNRCGNRRGNRRKFSATGISGFCGSFPKNNSTGTL